MQSHFERIFFSNHSKRLDFELTSVFHKDDQVKQKESNKSDPIFKEMKRVEITADIETFKNSIVGKYPDIANLNFRNT